uniref:Uncharacterized protein n=1 Tax=Panagrolaimus sp. ES5 TaxID=591445 RepID=A0AC34GB55_9BILA
MEKEKLKNVKKGGDQIIKRVGNTAESVLYSAKRYDIKLPAKGAVNVYDKTIKNAHGKATWTFRIDTPHPGAPTPHLNVNEALSGVTDPHIPISSGQLAAAQTTGKVLQKVNKVAVPIAIAIDTARVGYAIYKDVDNGTSRNVVETGASVAGGWGGGYVGAAGGAAIGTAIFPCLGTFVGAIVGGIVGGIGGSLGAAKLTQVVGDKLEYNVKKRKCRGCKKTFKARFYKGEKNQWLCKECRK